MRSYCIWNFLADLYSYRVLSLGVTQPHKFEQRGEKKSECSKYTPLPKITKSEPKCIMCRKEHKICYQGNPNLKFLISISGQQMSLTKV